MGAEQLLKIEPENELKFKGPYTSPTTSVLKLTNPTNKEIYFKIKTTAPKRYCVRPNAGLIEAGTQLSIAVVLQPCEVDSTANKHKFMVQAIAAPDKDISQDELWAGTPSSQVMETKLRCTFEVPSNDNATVSNHEITQPVEEKFSRSNKTEVESTSPKASMLHDDVDHNEDRTRQLKQENSQLKDEIERLKRKLKTQMRASEGVSTALTPPPSQTMFYVVFAIIVLMAGLLLGKFAL